MSISYPFLLLAKIYIHMQKKYKTLVIVLLLVNKLTAQTLTPTVIASSGGFYTSASAMLSTTVGEMTMVETFTSSANFLTQGFQQPEDLGVGISELVAGGDQVSAYPNPAVDEVLLKTNFSESGTLSFTMIDMLGQAVQENKSIKERAGFNSTIINVKALAGGVYFIKGDFVTLTKTQSFTLKLTINK